MHPLYDEFVGYLNAENKDGCVQLVLSSLQKQAVDIVTLYNEILRPAMYADFCTEEEEPVCVWREHVRTAIVRTVIECCYPYVIAGRDKKRGVTSRGKVVVVCPPEELHETGPRMVADFFTICGFEVVFTGANVPQDNIIAAVGYARPDYVAVSVTNYYNLMATRRLIMKLQEMKESVSFSIILGGQACAGNPDACREMGADYIIQTFEEIEKLGVVK